MKRVTWWPADLVMGKGPGDYTYHANARVVFAIDDAKGYGYYWLASQ